MTLHIIIFALACTALHAQEPPKSTTAASATYTCPDAKCVSFTAAPEVKNQVAIIVPPLPQDVGCAKERFCIVQNDYDKLFTLEGKWTFTIDGKEYKLTGEQLKEAVKKAAEPKPIAKVHHYPILACKATHPEDPDYLDCGPVRLHAGSNLYGPDGRIYTVARAAEASK